MSSLSVAVAHLVLVRCKTVMGAFLKILWAVVTSLIATLILTPIVVILCLPYLLLASLVDRGEYWSSFWWRTKRLASFVADIAGVVGAGAGM